MEIDTGDHLEPGDTCPEPDCDGMLDTAPSQNCSCHLSAPCSSCENSGLVCDECGFDTAEEWRRQRDIERDEFQKDEAELRAKVRGKRRHETTSTHTANPFNSTPFTLCCGVAAIKTNRCPNCEAQILWHDDGLDARRREVGPVNCLICGKKRNGRLGYPGVCCC